MAKTLIGAVVAKLVSSSVNSTATGGIWVGQVPETSALPFVALLHKGCKPDWTFETDFVEFDDLEIHCFAVGLAAAEALAQEVKDALDWQDLTVTSADVLGVERTNYQVAAEPERDASGDLVFSAITSYTTRTRKTLTLAPSTS